MTLEQIKNRQQLINSQLREQLQQITQLMDFILGSSQESEEKGIPVSPPEGLLNEINEQLDVTQILLGRINEQHRRLFDKTYAPAEIEKG